MNKKKKIIYRSLILIVLLLSLWILIGFLAAEYLVSSAHSKFNNILSYKGKKVRELKISTEDNLTISAWLIENNSDKAVILLSGVRADRRANLSRAENYLNKGYSVLLPDLRGTGMSDGDMISFGWHEQKDLRACFYFLNNQGYKKISAHGCSLGAAVILYSMKERVPFHFLVLESCYDNLENAFRNRVEKYRLPDFLYSPIRYVIPKKINTEIKDLSPEKYVGLISCPVLFMAGDEEEQVKVTETLSLFMHCQIRQKQLHIFKKGKHEDFKAKFRKEYDQVLNKFILKFEN